MSEIVSSELLELMVCSNCKSQLNFIKQQSKLVCTKCKTEFKIENGIPNMVLK